MISYSVNLKKYCKMYVQSNTNLLFTLLALLASSRWWRCGLGGDRESGWGHTADVLPRRVLLHRLGLSARPRPHFYRRSSGRLLSNLRIKWNVIIYDFLYSIMEISVIQQTSVRIFSVRCSLHLYNLWRENPKRNGQCKENQFRKWFLYIFNLYFFTMKI